MLRLIIISATPVILWGIMQAFSRVSIDNVEHKKNQYITVCGIFLFLILAMRNVEVGSGDALWYHSIWEKLSIVPFDKISEVFKTIDVEKGFLLFVAIFSKIFKDGQYIFVIYGAVVSLSVCHFIRKNCEIPVIGFEMFFCLGLWGFMVQGLRQGIAMCICLWSIDFVKKKKLLPFIILVTIAASFHGSAIVFFLVYFIKDIKISYKNIMLAIVAIVISNFFVDEIFDILNWAISDSYLINDLRYSGGGIFTALIYLIIIFWGLIILKPQNDKTNHTDLFYYMTILGLFSFLMRYTFNSIAQRIAYFFMFGQMVILPCEINLCNKKNAQILKVAVICLCLVMATYKSANSKLNPYTFFWE